MNIMKDKKQEYRETLCVLCNNKNVCKKDKIKVYEFQEQISIKCMEYEYVPDNI